MKVKTEELSEKQSKHLFEQWFERTFRTHIKERALPAIEQRKLMTMAWFGCSERSLLGDEVDIPDELMEVGE